MHKNRSTFLRQRNAFRVNAKLISMRCSTGDRFSVTLPPMPPIFGDISNPQPSLNSMAPSSFRTRASRVQRLMSPWRDKLYSRAGSFSSHYRQQRFTQGTSKAEPRRFFCPEDAYSRLPTRQNKSVQLHPSLQGSWKPLHRQRLAFVDFSSDPTQGVKRLKDILTRREFRCTHSIIA
jgi:hypothetical protein